MGDVTLNCDMGESYGIYSFGSDADLVSAIDVANIACGFHASDFSVMSAVVEQTLAANVQIGAHPSLPDRQGFGRRVMTMTREEIANCVIYQVGALTGFLRAKGGTLSHIKPHGALYGMAARDPMVAHAIADALDVFGVPVFGLEGTCHEEVYRARGHVFVSEFFPDLDYDDSGALVIKRSHDAGDPQIVADRVTRALEQNILVSQGGKEFMVHPRTICIHSDSPNAKEVAIAAAEAIAAWRSAASTKNLEEEDPS